MLLKATVLEETCAAAGLKKVCDFLFYFIVRRMCHRKHLSARKFFYEDSKQVNGCAEVEIVHCSSIFALRYYNMDRYIILLLFTRSPRGDCAIISV